MNERDPSAVMRRMVAAINAHAYMEAVPDLRVDIEREAVAGQEVWAELHVHGRRVDGVSIDEAVADWAAGT